MPSSEDDTVAVDFRFINYGSVHLCEPLSDKAFTRLLRIGGDGGKWFGRLLTVEHAAVEPISALLVGEGWVVG